MSDEQVVSESVDTARAVAALLASLGCPDKQAGRLAANLGDLYSGAQRVRVLIETLLRCPPSERSQTACDLAGELQHIRGHMRYGDLARLASLLDEDGAYEGEA